jgi:hypothetical protein
MEPVETAALIGLVGTFMTAVGYVVRPRIDKRNGTSHDSYLETDRAAVTSLTRDIEDVNEEMCGFHRRMEDQWQTYSSLLTDIKHELQNMNKNGVRQRLD